jgi:hypothetical protein
MPSTIAVAPIGEFPCAVLTSVRTGWWTADMDVPHLSTPTVAPVKSVSVMPAGDLDVLMMRLSVVLPHRRLLLFAILS